MTRQAQTACGQDGAAATVAKALVTRCNALCDLASVRNAVEALPHLVWLRPPSADPLY